MAAAPVRLEWPLQPRMFSQCQEKKQLCSTVFENLAEKEAPFGTKVILGRSSDNGRGGGGGVVGWVSLRN